MKTITACYDLNESPPTYDFFTFLAEAEKFRRARGADRIDLVFQPGLESGFRADGLPPDLIERRSMLQRVCVAGARLLPTISDVVCFGQRTNIKADFPVGYDPFRPVSHYGAAYQVNGLQCLRATDAARREVKRLVTEHYTTITVREAEYWPERNSDYKAWSRAARWLQFNGHNPVIIPDTHGSMTLHPGYEMTQAAWDIDLRMALYEGAALNLGVANGPMSLCMLAEKAPPYIIFGVGCEKGTANTKDFLASHGLHDGESFSKNGWTIWAKDTPENVILALEGHFFKKGEVAA